MQHMLAAIFTCWCGFLCASIWILLLPHTGHLQCAKHAVGVKTPTSTLHYGMVIASVLMRKQRLREVQVIGSARMRLTADRGVPERSFDPDSCQPPLLPCSAMQTTQRAKTTCSCQDGTPQPHQPIPGVSGRHPLARPAPPGASAAFLTFLHVTDSCSASSWKAPFSLNRLSPLSQETPGHPFHLHPGREGAKTYLATSLQETVTYVRKIHHSQNVSSQPIMVPNPSPLLFLFLV